jgi:uncharacterized damage-inducible protein DinB
MEPPADETHRILTLLAQAPPRLAEATRGVGPARLALRTEAEPWSVCDILAHLRACSDVWGDSIRAMIEQDDPKQRYKSPRAFMRKPKYQAAEFASALESFTQERQQLIKFLADLDEAGWERPGTFTGTSPRNRSQTVLSYAARMVNHEQPHLDQVEALLR